VLQERLMQLCGALSQICHFVEAPRTQTLDEAVALCEAGFASLKSRAEDADAKLAEQRLARERLDDEVTFAKDSFISLGIRLHAMHTESEPDREDPPTLQDALVYCCAALGPLNAEMKRPHMFRRKRASSRSKTPEHYNRTFTESDNEDAESTKPPRARRSFYGSGNSETGMSWNAPVLNHQTSWGADPTLECHVCNHKLGKRHLRRRHQCQVCGKCVCSKCSPNSLQLDETGRLGRVCTPCVASIHELPAFQGRMALISERLAALSAGKGDYKGDIQAVQENSACASIEHSLAQAEAALAAMEDCKDEACILVDRPDG